MVNNKEININIGDIYGDMKCVEIIPWTDPRNPLKHKRTTVYRMKCIKCGREKLRQRYVIFKLEGMFHKDCDHFNHMSDPIFYNRWQNMRDRTTNTKKKEADRYVNRGINSDEFRYFIDFYDALYPSWVEIRKKYPANEISLDRIDNDKSYTKDNCRWVYYKDQYNNKSNNKFLKVIYPDKSIEYTRCACAWCRDHGFNTWFVETAFKNVSGHSKGYRFEYITQEEYENLNILNQYENVNDENEISLDNGIVKTIGDTEYIFPENE